MQLVMQRRLPCWPRLLSGNTALIICQKKSREVGWEELPGVLDQRPAERDVQCTMFTLTEVGREVTRSGHKSSGKDIGHAI